MTDKTTFCSGFISIVGRPNVGKSTLLNHLIGQKVSITSRKAQTTRHRITGILTEEKTQFVFVDTPGFQTQYLNMLNKGLNKVVTSLWSLRSSPCSRAARWKRALISSATAPVPTSRVPKLASLSRPSGRSSCSSRRKKPRRKS